MVQGFWSSALVCMFLKGQTLYTVAVKWASVLGLMGKWTMKIFPCQITITAASFGYRAESIIEKWWRSDFPSVYYGSSVQMLIIGHDNHLTSSMMAILVVKFLRKGFKLEKNFSKKSAYRISSYSFHHELLYTMNLYFLLLYLALTFYLLLEEALINTRFKIY